MKMFWRKGSRFYLAFTNTTIFGERVFIQQWGSDNRGIIGEKKTLIYGGEQGRKLLKRVTKRRLDRGYVEEPSNF